MFERTASGLIATKEADELFGNATKIFSEIKKFKSRIRTLDADSTQTVRVAFAPSIGLSVGPQAIVSFLKQRPETRIEVETLHLDEATLALKSGEIDVAIVYEPHA